MTHRQHWPATQPGQQPELTNHTCHLWLVDLAVGNIQPDLLSQTEQARAARFKFPQHRQRFIASHTALRRILAGYVDAKPQQLVFQKAVHGKPSLTDYPDLHFNLSHSNTTALIAVARHEIGVDIEQVKKRDELKLAKRFFTQTEYQWLAAHATKDISPAFFKLWTRKEAVLKATGLGLHLPLDSFNVVPLAQTEHDGHHVENVTVTHGYQAAIAYATIPQPLQINRFTLTLKP